MKIFAFFALFCFLVLIEGKTLDFTLLYKGTCTGSTSYSCSGKASSQDIVTRIQNGIVSVDYGTLPGTYSNLTVTGSIIGKNYFKEIGSITFGTHQHQDHQLNFATVFNGYAIPVPGASHTGFSVAYNITGGTGVFDGSTGLLSASGTVDDSDGTLFVAISGYFYY